MEPFQVWLEKESARRQLVILGRDVARIQLAMARAEGQSSRALTGRVQDLVADYWRAMDEYLAENAADAIRLTSAAFLQVDFITGLLEAESAERELGEGMLFELDEPSDPQALKELVSAEMQEIYMELYALTGGAKANDNSL